MTKEYFVPISRPDSGLELSYQADDLGASIVFHQPGRFPDLDHVDIALLGVPESRGSLANFKSGEGIPHIRRSLYTLKRGPWSNLRVADLGDLIPGEGLLDTYAALEHILNELLGLGVTPIIIGGGQDLTIPMFEALSAAREKANLVCVDSAIDLRPDSGPNSKSFLNHIFLNAKSRLFNFTNLGFQTYYNAPESVDLLDQLYFEAYRLGEIKANIKLVEPVIRDADIISLDIGAVAMQHAPGCSEVHPNGLTGREYCAIARYAGLSDKVRGVGFFEYHPENDQRGITAHLIAQAIWYFLEGFRFRMGDFPSSEHPEYQRYIVPIEEHSLYFHRSKSSNRWWMEVEGGDEEPLLVPCTYDDYLSACHQDIPDRWWKTYRKLLKM